MIPACLILRPRALAILATVLIALAPSGKAAAAALRIAVASNFATTATVISQLFERATGHRVILSPGATGRHFAQIVHGAPFDIFLAAGAARPRKLEKMGRAVTGTRFTYALGRLVLWSPRPGYVDKEGKILSSAPFAHLAMANPRLAPYGQAARETLRHLGLWEKLRPRIVRGENAAQTFHFIKSGAAPLGFVSAAQVITAGPSAKGSQWPVPSGYHAPIRQQAILIRDTSAARAFLAFLRSARARHIIASRGYDLP